MKFRSNVAAAAILAAGLVVSVTNANGQTPQPTKHSATRRAKKEEGPSVQDQINSLRQEMQTQIDSLKSDLATKDDQLKQAQQQAADAQAAAAKAQAAADAEQQSFTENSQAVTTLQDSVRDLKANQASLAERSPRKRRASRRRSPIPTSSTSREWLSHSAAASWRLKQRGARVLPAATSTRPLPASRWTTPRHRS